MFAAIEEQNLSNINTLISFHPNIVHARNSQGKTALHEAIEAENIEAMYFLIKNGADINAPTASGITPLHFACIKRSKEKNSIIKLLLQFGAKTNSKEKLFR